MRGDHTSHIVSWLEVLKNDKRAMFQAPSNAQRAVAYLRMAEPDIFPTSFLVALTNPAPDRRRSRSSISRMVSSCFRANAATFFGAIRAGEEETLPHPLRRSKMRYRKSRGPPVNRDDGELRLEGTLRG